MIIIIFHFIFFSFKEKAFVWNYFSKNGVYSPLEVSKRDTCPWDDLLHSYYKLLQRSNTLESKHVVDVSSELQINIFASYLWNRILVLYLHQSVKNEGGHTLFLIVLLKQDLHHRVPKGFVETTTL